MSIKPIVNDSTALDNRSLNIFANAVSCNELTVNGKPIHEDGNVTPFIPVLTFPNVPPPDEPTISNPGDVRGSIAGDIVTIFGRIGITLKAGTENGFITRIILPPEISSTLGGSGVGAVLLNGSDVNFPTPTSFAMIGRGVVANNNLDINFIYCSGVTTPGIDIDIDCSWTAIYPLR
jgi:hypothetical protein